MPPTWLLLALVATGILHFGLPLARIVPRPWHLTGLLPLLGGAVLNLIADRDFRRAATMVKPFEQSNVLLTQGVFRFSRNPMYLGSILILVGAALLLGSLSPWLAIPPFAWILSRFYVRQEEAMLAAAFGERWQAYRAATRRWLG
jgi:protein-S-isoprenylcysteine O-methyltransferase Ste14